MYRDNLEEAVDIGYKVVEILENLTVNPLCSSDPIDRKLVECITHLAKQNTFILKELNNIRRR